MKEQAMRNVASEFGYTGDGHDLSHATGHKLYINEAGWIHKKSSGFPNARTETTGTGPKSLETRLSKLHTSLQAATGLEMSSLPSPSAPPICEECDEEMERYEDAPDTGKGGWACPGCGWSQDD